MSIIDFDWMLHEKALGGLFGVAGGASGTGFAKPKMAPIVNPVSPDDIAQSKYDVKDSVSASQRLLEALAKAPGANPGQQRALTTGEGLANQLGSSKPVDAEQAAMGRQDVLNKKLGAADPVATENAAIAQQGALNKGIGNIGGADLARDAGVQQRGLNSDLGGAGGVQAQTGAIGGLRNVYAQQQGTADQLQNIANGQGPNPAQAMLNQATGQNVANQAALMAGQRGASANAGLIARQAAMQGAGIQQNAAGQGATMQANQSLGALGQLGGQQQAMSGTQQSIAGIGAGLTGQEQAGIAQQYGQGMGAIAAGQTGVSAQYGQGASQVGQQQTGITQQYGQGATGVDQYGRQIGQNATIASDIAGRDLAHEGNVIAATKNYGDQTLADQGQTYGAVHDVNTNTVSSQNNVNSVNGGLAGGKMTQQGQVIGGIGNALGAGAGAVFGEKKPPPSTVPGADSPAQPDQGLSPGVNTQEQVPKDSTTTYNGNMVEKRAPANTSNQAPNVVAQSNSAPNPDSSVNPGFAPPVAPPPKLDSEMVDQYAAGGVVGPQSSFGRFLTNHMANGGMARDLSGGGGVQAASAKQKAVKSGNSYDNDKIPAVLSEGEVVIPRSVMQSKDPARSAADFVRKVIAKRGKR